MGGTNHSETPRIRLLRRTKRLAFSLVAVVLGLAMIEGLCSLGLLFTDFFVSSDSPLTERSHTTYDAELGWVSQPSTSIADLYGPGRSITTNSQGFRGHREYPKEVPSGKIRIICSGDSFTLGYGVGDEDTWCAQLEANNPGLEVINMGQGGYGLDQSYLWYSRDGRTLDHQVHVFAIIYEDLNRMCYDSFLGYGKPILKYDGERLISENVPVPRRQFYVPWLTQNTHLFYELRTSIALTRVFGLDSTRILDRKLTTSEAMKITHRAIDAMHQGDLEHKSRLVVVWLPTELEHTPSENLDLVRTRMMNRWRSRGILTIDLIDEFRKLPARRVPPLFFSGEGVDPLLAGHYTEQGCSYVAKKLEDAFRSISFENWSWPE